MIKFYEVAPEYMKSPIYDCDFAPGGIYCEITLTGNRDLREHKSRVYKEAEMIYDDILNCDLDAEDVCREYDIVDREQLEKAYGTRDTRTIMCLLMGALTRRKWGRRTIRGSCQGDWMIMYYPVDMWTRDSLLWFETAYWNMGSEWIVEDGDSRVGVYSCEWDEDKLKADLASQYGVDLKDCEFYRFDGWKREPKYKSF